MKRIICNISAILMAFVVLLSTMSFTLDMHYCGNTLVDVALFKEAKVCSMEQQGAVTSSCATIKKSCCTDKQFTFEGQDELKISFEKISFEQQTLVAVFYYTYLNLFKESEYTSIPFDEYPPPIIVRDIHLLNETFLI